MLITACTPRCFPPFGHPRPHNLIYVPSFQCSAAYAADADDWTLTTLPRRCCSSSASHPPSPPLSGFRSRNPRTHVPFRWSRHGYTSGSFLPRTYISLSLSSSQTIRTLPFPLVSRPVCFLLTHLIPHSRRVTSSFSYTQPSQVYWRLLISSPVYLQSPEGTYAKLLRSTEGTPEKQPQSPQRRGDDQR